MKKNADHLVKYCFNDTVIFNDCKNKAFTSFMNKEFYAKQLSNYCDFTMKVDIKGNTESQIEEKIDNIIGLFKCLNNKLAFQLEYTVRYISNIEKTLC